MKMPSAQRGFTLIELLVVITIIAILAGIALPVFTNVQERGAQTKSLANAKQIGLACKLWATDNEGQYPNRDDEGNVIPNTSPANDFFKTLIPSYCPTEKPFFTAGSPWNTRNGVIQPPDEVTTLATDRLAAGENTYAYVTGLTETSNPNFPLVADGFSDTVGQYTKDKAQRGGVWKGQKAIVIRVDQSGAVEKVRTTNDEFRVYGPTGENTNKDIFAAATNWLNADTNKVVNPTPGN